MAELISVIVPHYNRNDLIPGLLENISCQTYRPLEVIIVDDGSDAPLAGCFENYEGVDVRLLNIPHCGRPGLVRNEGILAAKGRYVAFLDSDDLWLPDKLTRQVELFESDPDIDLCHGNAKIIKNSGGSSLYKDRPDRSRVSYKELLINNSVLTSSVLVKREVLLSDLFSDLPSAQDYELWLRLSKKIKFSYLSEPMYIYSHTRKDSISRKGSLRYLSLIKIFKNELNGYLEKNVRKLIEKRISDFYLKLAKWEFYKGNKKRCAAFIRKAMSVYVTKLSVQTLVLLYTAPKLLEKLYKNNRDF